MRCPKCDHQFSPAEQDRPVADGLPFIPYDPKVATPHYEAPGVIAWRASEAGMREYVAVATAATRSTTAPEDRR